MTDTAPVDVTAETLPADPETHLPPAIAERLAGRGYRATLLPADDDSEGLRVLLLEYTPPQDAGPDPRLELYRALIEAQATAAQVAKSGHNTHARYDYAKADDIIAAAKSALGAHGLGLLPEDYELKPVPEGTPQIKDRPIVWIVERKWTLIHVAGGTKTYTVRWPVCIIGRQEIDKALGAALTGGLAYMLRDLLQLPRVDEADDMNTDAHAAQQTGDAPEVSQQPKTSKAWKRADFEAACKKGGYSPREVWDWSLRMHGNPSTWNKSNLDQLYKELREKRINVNEQPEAKK